MVRERQGAQSLPGRPGGGGAHRQRVDAMEQVEKLLTENMESAYELAVKLKADLNEGESWYELK